MAAKQKPRPAPVAEPKPVETPAAVADVPAPAAFKRHWLDDKDEAENFIEGLNIMRNMSKHWDNEYWTELVRLVNEGSWFAMFVWCEVGASLDCRRRVSGLGPITPRFVAGDLERFVRWQDAAGPLFGSIQHDDC